MLIRTTMAPGEWYYDQLSGGWVLIPHAHALRTAYHPEDFYHHRRATARHARGIDLDDQALLQYGHQILQPPLDERGGYLNPREAVIAAQLAAVERRDAARHAWEADMGTVIAEAQRNYRHYGRDVHRVPQLGLGRLDPQQAPVAVQAPRRRVRQQVPQLGLSRAERYAAIQELDAEWRRTDAALRGGGYDDPHGYIHNRGATARHAWGMDHDQGLRQYGAERIQAARQVAAGMPAARLGWEADMGAVIAEAHLAAVERRRGGHAEDWFPIQDPQGRREAEEQEVLRHEEEVQHQNYIRSLGEQLAAIEAMQHQIATLRRGRYGLYGYIDRILGQFDPRYRHGMHHMHHGHQAPRRQPRQEQVPQLRMAEARQEPVAPDPRPPTHRRGHHADRLIGMQGAMDLEMERSYARRLAGVGGQPQPQAPAPVPAQAPVAVPQAQARHQDAHNRAQAIQAAAAGLRPAATQEARRGQPPNRQARRPQPQAQAAPQNQVYTLDIQGLADRRRGDLTASIEFQRSFNDRIKELYRQMQAAARRGLIRMHQLEADAARLEVEMGGLEENPRVGEVRRRQAKIAEDLSKIEGTDSLQNEDRQLEAEMRQLENPRLREIRERRAEIAERLSQNEGTDSLQNEDRQLEVEMGELHENPRIRQIRRRRTEIAERLSRIEERRDLLLNQDRALEAEIRRVQNPRLREIRERRAEIAALLPQIEAGAREQINNLHGELMEFLRRLVLSTLSMALEHQRTMTQTTTSAQDRPLPSTGEPPALTPSRGFTPAGRAAPTPPPPAPSNPLPPTGEPPMLDLSYVLSYVDMFFASQLHEYLTLPQGRSTFYSADGGYAKLWVELIQLQMGGEASNGAVPKFLVFSNASTDNGSSSMSFGTVNSHHNGIPLSPEQAAANPRNLIKLNIKGAVVADGSLEIKGPTMGFCKPKTLEEFMKLIMFILNQTSVLTSAPTIEVMGRTVKVNVKLPVPDNPIDAENIERYGNYLAGLATILQRDNIPNGVINTQECVLIFTLPDALGALGDEVTIDSIKSIFEQMQGLRRAWSRRTPVQVLMGPRMRSSRPAIGRNNGAASSDAPGRPVFTPEVRGSSQVGTQPITDHGPQNLGPQAGAEQQVTTTAAPAQPGTPQAQNSATGVTGGSSATRPNPTDNPLLRRIEDDTAAYYARLQPVAPIVAEVPPQPEQQPQPHATQGAEDPVIVGVPETQIARTGGQTMPAGGLGLATPVARRGRNLADLLSEFGAPQVNTGSGASNSIGSLAGASEATVDVQSQAASLAVVPVESPATAEGRSQIESPATAEGRSQIESPATAEGRSQIESPATAEGRTQDVTRPTRSERDAPGNKIRDDRRPWLDRFTNGSQS